MSMRKYAVRGVGIGLILSFLAFLTIGGGHGTYIPCWVFFAPIALLSPQSAIVGGGTFLYLAYAILLELGNRRCIGLIVLIAMMLIHCCAVVLFAFFQADWWDYEYLQEFWKSHPLLLMVDIAFFVNVITVSFKAIRKRRDIRGSKKLSCRICTTYNMDTASDYEYPCLILRDWICETHCAEIQLCDDEDTRGYVLQILGKPHDSMGENVGYSDMVKKCNRCPYGPIIV